MKIKNTCIYLILIFYTGLSLPEKSIYQIRVGMSKILLSTLGRVVPMSVIWT
jgi:hypothetical protein